MKQTSKYQTGALIVAYAAGMLVMSLVLNIGHFKPSKSTSSASEGSALAELQIKCEAAAKAGAVLEGCDDLSWVVGQGSNKYAEGVAPRSTTQASHDAKQNFIKNGSFETPVLSVATSLIPSTNPELGWQVAWVKADNPKVAALTAQPVLEIMSSLGSWTPRDGKQFAKLDVGSATKAAGQRSLVSIAQRMAGLGTESYTLSFWYAAQPGTTKAENTLTVTWNDRVLDTLTSDGASSKDAVWQSYSYTVTPNQGVGEIVFKAGGTENRKGVLLDNVSLTQN